MLVHPNSDALIARLPHRAPMRLIDVVFAAGQGTAICGARLNLERCHLFGDGLQSLDSCLGIELVAQAAAVAMLQNDRAGMPLRGKIAQVKSFHSHLAKWGLNSEARIMVEIDYTDGSPLAIANGRIEIEDIVACEASLTLTVES